MTARASLLGVAIGAATTWLAAAPTPAQGVVSALPTDCVKAMRDGAGGSCIKASSTPELGRLYPLSEHLNVDPMGRVGMGTTVPAASLEVRSQIEGRQGIRAYGADSAADGSTGVRTHGGSGLQSGAPGLEASGGAGFVNASGPGVVATGAPQLEMFGAAGVLATGGAGASGGIGVHGRGGDGTFTSGGPGIVGTPGLGSSPGLAVFAQGDFGGTGAKYFLQPHPTDASRELRFVCLEGNESGTYFRGSGRTHGGLALIEVPEEFRLATSPSAGVTVQTTAIGARADLWIESKGLQRIVVRSDVDVDFDYFVNGVRRGFEDLDVIATNRSFVPEYADEPFGAQYPAGLRQLLVENGTLNPDFTPNEATARQLGWTLKHPDARPTWERPR